MKVYRIIHYVIDTEYTLGIYSTKAAALEALNMMFSKLTEVEDDEYLIWENAYGDTLQIVEYELDEICDHGTCLKKET